jgi:hypothetical protein
MMLIVLREATEIDLQKEARQGLREWGMPALATLVIAAVGFLLVTVFAESSRWNFLGAMMLALAALGFFASGCATLWYAATLAALSLAPWRSRLFQTPLISGAWLGLYAFFLRLAKAPLTDVLARAELGWGTALLCGVVFRASLPFWRKYPTSTPE